MYKTCAKSAIIYVTRTITCLLLTLNAPIATKVVCFSRLLKASMANNVDQDQTAPIGAVCSGYTLFASILNSSEMLGNYMHHTTFSDAFAL